MKPRASGTSGTFMVVSVRGVMMKSKYMFGKGHPHEGEGCFAKLDEHTRTIGGVNQYPFYIIDCSHGVEWCYAEYSQITVCQGGLRDED